MTAATIPEDVIEGLMEVRASGAVNMFDRRGIIEVAIELGEDATASWMRNKANRPAYIAWLTGR